MTRKRLGRIFCIAAGVVGASRPLMPQISSGGVVAAPSAVVDFTSAGQTIPARKLASDPATCTAGETYFNTTSGVLKVCTAANTWTSYAPPAGASGGIPYYPSATGMASSGTLSANSVVVGGGAGGAPKTTGVTIDGSNNISTSGTLTTGVAGSVHGKLALGELPSYGSTTVGWEAPDSITTALSLQFPNGTPTANSFMLFPAPTSNIAQFTWTNFAFANLADALSSAHLVGTNGSKVPVTATAADVSAVEYVTGGGAAQAQTAVYSPAIASLTDGLRVCWRPAAANTGSGVTFSPNNLTAHTIVKTGGAALAANDITTTAVACAIYDLASTQWELQNPQASSGGAGSMNVNGSGVSGPNFNATAPAAGTNYVNATFQVSSSSVTAEVPMAEQPASVFGLVGDNSTDNGTAITNVPPGSYVHLMDNAKYNIGAAGAGGAVTWPSNVKWECNGCSFVYAGAPTNYPFQWTGTNQTYGGVTFDLNGTNTGAYNGASAATSAVTVTAGGSGFAPNSSFNVSFTGGGCADEPNGYATTNSSGVITSVTLTKTGTDCTSAPSINTTFTSYPACPRGGTCANPTFSYATPSNTTGPTHQYGFYVSGATNWQCHDCSFRSTGSTTASGSRYMDGIKVYNSTGKLLRPTVDNTIGGYQIQIDSNGTLNPFLVDHPKLDGSGFAAIQIHSSNSSGTSNVEVAGGYITGVTDASYGTGQWGNGISIFTSSNNNVHDVTIINPRFSGVRITGNSSVAQTHLAQHNVVARNHVMGCGEVAFWAELGAEENTFDANDATGCNAGMNLNNGNQRPDYGMNLANNNTFKNMLYYGILAQHDKLQGNTVYDTPECYLIGNGGVGSGIISDTNKCYRTGASGTIPAQVAYAIDSGLNSAANNQNIRLQFPFTGASSGAGGPEASSYPIAIASVNNSAGLQITAMTLANPPQFTFNSGSATVGNGETWILQNIPSATLSDGVTPVNGQLCTISSASSTTFTCTNLNTTGGTAYAAPPFGNPASTATRLYTSTGAPIAVPSMVSIYGKPEGCSDSSGSGTAQSCSTSPIFVPQAGDRFVYTTTTTNTGALTITLNGIVMPVHKGQGIAVASGDVPANVPVVMTFDGTNLNTQTIGNIPLANPMTNPNDMIIGGTAGVPARLAAANSSVLVTNGSGVESFATTLPSSLTIPAPAITNPQTTVGSSLSAGWGSGFGIPGSGLTAGEVYYQGASGLALAEANASSTVPGLCVAISATLCVYSGVYRFSSTQSWIAGAILYVSDATAGAMLTSAPTTLGHYVQRIGVALAADTMLIKPSIDVVGNQ